VLSVTSVVNAQAVPLDILSHEVGEMPGRARGAPRCRFLAARNASLLVASSSLPPPFRRGDMLRDARSLRIPWIEAEGREEEAMTDPAGQGTGPYVGAYSLIVLVQVT
jgi:hypothetical protein